MMKNQLNSHKLHIMVYEGISLFSTGRRHTLSKYNNVGGDDVSDYIERKANELNQIDADTALTVFFFGLNIGRH